MSDPKPVEPTSETKDKETETQPTDKIAGAGSDGRDKPK